MECELKEQCNYHEFQKIDNKSRREEGNNSRHFNFQILRILNLLTVTDCMVKICGLIKEKNAKKKNIFYNQNEKLMNFFL